MQRIIRKVISTAAAVSVIALSTAFASPTQNKTDFTLRSVDGPAVTAESLHGEVVVLAFGASWLPLTRNQMEGLKKVADEYAGRGVVVYWVSTESDSAKSKNFVGDDELRTLGRKYKITVLRDPDGPISRRLGVDQLPATVIINKEGQVAASVGGLDPNADIAKQLAERLNKIL